MLYNVDIDGIYFAVYYLSVYVSIILYLFASLLQKAQSRKDVLLSLAFKRSFNERFAF